MLLHFGEFGAQAGDFGFELGDAVESPVWEPKPNGEVGLNRPPVKSAAGALMSISLPVSGLIPRDWPGLMLPSPLGPNEGSGLSVKPVGWARLSSAKSKDNASEAETRGSSFIGELGC